MKYLLLQDPPEQIIDYLKTFEYKEMITPQTEVNKLGFTQLMATKGYKASSPQTIMSFCKQYNLTRTKRGKNYWYKVAEINKIPNNF